MAGAIVFSHPRLKQNLSIRINPDQITWDYGLNTASFPTYGGEVVQILSVYFGDMTIKGKVSSSVLKKQFKQLGDTFSGFVQAFVQSKLDTIPQFADASKAADHNFKGLNQVGVAAAAGSSGAGVAATTAPKVGGGTSSGSP